ncbi:MAG: hypothetical protein WAZ27_00970 [Minisyncoccia bacterium]
MTDSLDISAPLRERFTSLPKVLRDAITSSDVQKHLRGLADGKKLHVDQWQILENEVMLALLGFNQVEDLEENIISKLGITKEDAHMLATDINNSVFEPIRQELERQLEHPDAAAVVESGPEAARTQILGAETAAATPSTPPQTPAPTPPAEKPVAPVVRMPASGAYKPGEASVNRASVVDDPYREPPK